MMNPDPDPDPDKSFKIGNTVFEPASNEVRIGAETKRIEPRLLLVLQCLVGRAGQSVTREILLDSAWPTGKANDESLTQAISTLRALLKDCSKSPKFIETIPKIGYRFIGEVQPDESPGPVRRAETPATQWRRFQILPGWIVVAVVLVTTIVILLNLEDDPDPDYDIEIEDVDLVDRNPDPQLNQARLNSEL